VDDFPTRIADFLESVTTRIRSMTIDPIARVITWVTLGLVALVLVGFSLTFLLVGIFRIVGELVRKACDCTSYMEITYAVVGGVFLLIGALVWAKRLAVHDRTVGENANE
jgi:phosphate/sulfate permease